MRTISKFIVRIIDLENTFENPLTNRRVNCNIRQMGRENTNHPRDL